ncbi:MAG: hypothetical protein KAR36_02990 [Candidatus Latescibacteria bacterium]|nr:hypothetical protein [Candidatus Latescibacterota bacterium]
MSRAIVPIVEGYSEVASVPILLRRILEREAAYSVQVAKPFRVKRNRVVKEGELERAIEQVVRSRSGAGGILVLLDADDDCPPQNPEMIRGAKERLTKNMQGQRYMEVDDQPALAARMDLELAKARCPSFEKFLRGVHFLISEMTET